MGEGSELDLNAFEGEDEEVEMVNRIHRQEANVRWLFGGGKRCES